MKTYTVYRVETNKTERIGKVVDRRRGERNDNALDMLRLAQKIFATSSMDSNIFILRESSIQSIFLSGGSRPSPAR